MNNQADILSKFRDASRALAAGEYELAERLFLSLVEHQPLWAWNNLGIIYGRSGRLETAERAFRKAIAAGPEAPLPKYGLALLLLKQGRWTEGWQLHDARLRLSDAQLPQTSLPLWGGEDLSKKHIVVIREQGLGDQIQFARFLPALRKSGAAVTFICSPALAPLFTGMDVSILSAGEPHAISADFWSPVLSLPRWLGVTTENLTAAPYLPIRQLGRGGGIGVAPTGAPNHANNQDRSLWNGDAARLLRMGQDLRPEVTGAADFAETAARIAELDLVVSVDTSIAHLAAAMGKPTWILLLFEGTDWRWLQDRRDSPWYPSVRLYRQPASRDWTPVLEAVEADLAARGRASRP